MKKAWILTLITILSISFLPLGALFAQTKSTVKVEPLNDFVIEPSKFEVFLNPGESVTKTLNITNRIPQTVEFTVTAEDFRGSDNPNQPVVLLGDERGPYSLKNF